MRPQFALIFKLDFLLNKIYRLKLSFHFITVTMKKKISPKSPTIFFHPPSSTSHHYNTFFPANLFVFSLFLDCYGNAAACGGRVSSCKNWFPLHLHNNHAADLPPYVCMYPLGMRKFTRDIRAPA